MRRLIESLCFLAVAVACGWPLARARPPRAGFFRAKTSQPGVTIVQAVRNGQQLPVAGQNGAATFFRIDNPTGPVPCSNRLHSPLRTAQRSTPRSISAPTTGRWLTLTAQCDSVSGGRCATRAGSEACSAARRGRRRAVASRSVIATDDPDVTITKVFLRGKQVPIAARAGPIRPDQCRSAVRRASNARATSASPSPTAAASRASSISARQLLVVVALVGGPRPPAPPPS